MLHGKAVRAQEGLARLSLGHGDLVGKRVASKQASGNRGGTARVVACPRAAPSPPLHPAPAVFVRPGCYSVALPQPGGGYSGVFHFRRECQDFHLVGLCRGSERPDSTVHDMHILAYNTRTSSDVMRLQSNRLFDYR